MAKLTRAEFDQMQEAEAPPQETTEKEKTDMIAKVFNWQQSEDLYAWDEEGLQETLDMSIQGFTLAGKNEDGDPIEVEFLRPLDEDVEFEGVAYGFRLIMVQEGPPLYTLQEYAKPDPSEEAEETE